MFEKDRINTGRQIEVDLSRGFTAIIIIVCHVGLYLGNPDDTGLYVFSDIIGSEFGAPIFMSLMGLSIVYSKHNSAKEMLKRGVNLLLGGYLLSSFRTLLPMLIFGKIDSWCELPAFFVVDIMQFAGLSFLLIALFKKLRLPSWAVLAISIGMVGIGQIVMSMSEPLVDNEWAGYFVNLFFPVTEWSCFPLFIWFCFPVFGMCFGELLVRCKNKNKMYGILLPISLCGVLHVYWHFHSLYPEYTTYYFGNNFYYMGIQNVLFNFTFVTFSLSIWHFASRILPECVEKLLTFLSRHLNNFYIITWIYISILIHLTAYFGLVYTVIQVVLMMAILLVLCLLTAKVFLAVKQRKE